MIEPEDPNRNKHIWILATISFIFIAGFFVLIVMSIFKFIPDDTQAHQVFNVISNALMLVLSYWFGSSHGDR